MNCRRLVAIGRVTTMTTLTTSSTSLVLCGSSKLSRVCCCWCCCCHCCWSPSSLHLRVKLARYYLNKCPPHWFNLVVGLTRRVESHTQHKHCAHHRICIARARVQFEHAWNFTVNYYTHKHTHTLGRYNRNKETINLEHVRVYIRAMCGRRWCVREEAERRWCGPAWAELLCRRLVKFIIGWKCMYVWMCRAIWLYIYICGVVWFEFELHWVNW